MTPEALMNKIETEGKRFHDNATLFVTKGNGNGEA